MSHPHGLLPPAGGRRRRAPSRGNATQPPAKQGWLGGGRAGHGQPAVSRSTADQPARGGPRQPNPATQRLDRPPIDDHSRYRPPPPHGTLTRVTVARPGGSMDDLIRSPASPYLAQVARVYGHLLGGCTTQAVDRELADQLR